MEWNKINLDRKEKYVPEMGFPRCDFYQVNTVEVVVCYTTKDKLTGRIAKKYDLGWFDHDGENWYCQLRYSNKDQVQEYVAWAYLDEYESGPQS